MATKHFANHEIWSYCTFLGMFTFKRCNYDLGLYLYNGSISLAIVYGNKPEQYFSGDVDLKAHPSGYPDIAGSTIAPIARETIKRARLARLI